MRKRRWTVLPKHAGTDEFARRLGVSPIIAQVLLNRGISDIEAGRAFLSPSLMALHPPDQLPGVMQAAARIADAVRLNQKIVIYGDYDVDGITATAILWHAIRLLGGEVDYYIPHRIDEGYGLSEDAIGQLCDSGAQLIVSVDCGITALGPAEVARSRGVDLIITDHHEWRTDGQMPTCFCLVHPRLEAAGDGYPNPHLCGSGVAMKLAWAVAQQFAGGNGKVSSQLRQFLLDATSLAALATIADVMPLVGENRVLTHFGLMGLKGCSLTGVRALLESADLLNERLDSYHVGFLLAPRLNACGRMGHAADAVELLTRADADRARQIAADLDQLNRQRQSTEREILDQAMRQIEELKLDSQEHRAIVVGGEGWHGGVIGIVASRIVDRYHRPTVVMTLNDDFAQGSGRSVAGFHLANALAAMGDLVSGSGGHEMAAGVRLPRANFEAFRSRFAEYAAEHMTAEMLLPELRIEVLADLSHIDRPLVDTFSKLGPFGQGNPRPLLGCTAVELVSDPNVVGRNGDHLQLRVRQGQTAMKCIAFKFGELAPRLRKGMRVDLAVEPCLNTFNGYTSVELEVKDIRLGE